MQEYVSGICNISSLERRKRLKVSLLSFSFFIVIFLLIKIFEISEVFTILSFPFIFSGVLGFIQYKTKFCAYFGLKGLFNTSINEISETKNLQFLKKDRLKALQIIILSFFISFSVYLAFLAIF